MIGYAFPDAYSVLRDLQRRNSNLQVLHFDGSDADLMRQIGDTVEQANIAFRQTVLNLGKAY